MKSIMFIFFLLSCTLSFAQQAPETHFGALENLIGGKWVTKGKWKSGAEYHQEIKHEWELSKTIVIVKTYDFVDSKQFEDSMRNYGVRAWDEQKKQITFYDFNVFGGIVTGTVTINGKDIYYLYEYVVNGKQEMVTDGWLYKDDNTYDYQVGIYNNGTWEKIFIKTVYKRITD